jgi:3-methylfumaryl-CoA hydratase
LLTYPWIGKQEEFTDQMTLAPVKALIATLDRNDPDPKLGDYLPELWHWLYFLPMAKQSNIGPDGHPQRGGFLPPVPLPRRMWAGGRFQWHQAITLGEEVTRRSTVKSVTHKSGRTGDLVFVLVEHQLFGPQGLALTEEHDIVYRPLASPNDVPPAPTAAPSDSDWEVKIDPSPVLLFRYSALTFNGHRIHYDRKYVTEVEGYPGLIVHGPLISTMLVDQFRLQFPQRKLASFEFKALRPTFDINHFYVCGKVNEENLTAELWAKDHEGWLTMSGKATFIK